MRTPDRLLTLVPEPLRSLLEKRRETVKFLLVGGTCFVITTSVNYLLKLTVLKAKPVTALIIAIAVATVVSYVLNREWSFSARGGRRRHTEMLLFIVVNLIATGINALPEWVARYVFDLTTPNVTRTVEEISDFASGLIMGTALAMVFRWWAFRTWVFPEQRDDSDDPDREIPEISKLSKSPVVKMVPNRTAARTPVGAQAARAGGGRTPQPARRA